MEGLTPEQLEHFKNKLIEKRRDIESQLQEFAKKNDKIKDDYETIFPQLGDDPDRDENADEVTFYTDNLAVEQDLESNLLSIDEALERIDKGTYGWCENCKQFMSIERLEAMPEATLCIKCE